MATPKMQAQMQREATEKLTAEIAELRAAVDNMQWSNHEVLERLNELIALINAWAAQ